MTIFADFERSLPTDGDLLPLKEAFLLYFEQNDVIIESYFYI